MRAPRLHPARAARAVEVMLLGVRRGRVRLQEEMAVILAGIIQLVVLEIPLVVAAGAVARGTTLTALAVAAQRVVQS